MSSLAGLSNSGPILLSSRDGSFSTERSDTWLEEFEEVMIFELQVLVAAAVASSGGFFPYVDGL